MPIIIALYKYIPAIDNFKQAVFAGWFGPIGVGALFYYSIAVPEFSDEASYAITVIEPVIYFMILASVLVHGITIPAFYLGSVVTQTVFKSKTNNSDDTLREDVRCAIYLLFIIT